MSRVIIILVIGFFLGISLILVANAMWVKKQLDDERAFVGTYLGEKTGNYIDEKTDEIFTRWFVQTRAVEHTYDFLLFNRSYLKRVVRSIAPAVLRWIQQRLEAFWWLVYQSLYRLILAAQWAPYLLPIIFACIVDGYYQRKIYKSEMAYANTVHYHVAWNIITFLLLAPIVYVAIPVSIHPLFVPAWGIIMAGATYLLFSSLQHRL
jgi:hypothetical protein